MTYFECVCVQRAMRMRRVVSRGLPAVPYFSTFSHKRHDFREKVIEHKMLVFFYILCNFCLNISHSKEN